jgi:cytochrome c biogenesis protein CcmG/thiol:disulfide interchange protein DsbE
VVYFVIGLGHDPRVVPSVLIDQPVPAFSLPAIEGMDGRGLADADLKGGVSVVNVFASWCLPCKAEHPLIQRMADDRLASVYGLNYKDKPEDARKWLAELGNPYAAIGADRDGRVGIDWGVYGVPETFIVDRSGRIRHKHVGAITPDALKDEIVPILRELAR